MESGRRFVTREQKIGAYPAETPGTRKFSCARTGENGGREDGEALTSITALLPALWKDLPDLLDDVGRALTDLDADYAQFLDRERLMVTAAAQVALQDVVESADQRYAEDPGEDPDPAGGAEMALAPFEEAGRDHFRRHRPLRALLFAYQAGGRVAWRHISAIAVRQGLPADVLAALAEGVFRAVDRISTVTTNGYLLEQRESAGMQQQLRNALAEQLLSGGADRAALERLADQAGWPLPAEAAVVLVRCDDEAAATALARLATSCLQIHSRALPGVIVPDPGAPGARQRLSTLLRGCAAVVGPTVALSGLPDSAAVATDALWLLELRPAGEVPFFVDEYLDAIIVHRDERLLNSLRAGCLAPLEGAARGSRQAFQDTLRSWLVHMGDRRAVAADLHVHPQTVRYRLNRLHELFGPRLDDPRERLRLMLALAWDAPGTREDGRSAAPQGRPSRGSAPPPTARSVPPQRAGAWRRPARGPHRPVARGHGVSTPSAPPRRS